MEEREECLGKNETGRLLEVSPGPVQDRSLATKSPLSLFRMFPCALAASETDFVSFVGEAEFLVARNLVAVCVLEASLQKV